MLPKGFRPEESAFALISNMIPLLLVIDLLRRDQHHVKLQWLDDKGSLRSGPLWVAGLRRNHPQECSFNDSIFLPQLMVSHDDKLQS